jgi:hypothetical protein
MIFQGNTHIQYTEKVFEKVTKKKKEVLKLSEFHEVRFEDQEKILTLSIHLGLLNALKDKDPMDIRMLSEITGFTSKKIIKFIEYHRKSEPNTLYLLTEKCLSLREKILHIFGLISGNKYSVSLSSEGKKIFENLSA